MKKFFLVSACLAATFPMVAQKPNYELAERFSAKKVGQMVFSTQMRPSWFRDSDRFWYTWSTSDGTRYWIVDPAAGTKTELFDMDRLAMQISEITRDPFEAKHLPLTNLKLKDDKYFVVSDFYDSCYFVTNDAAGDLLLPMIIRPMSYLEFNRQALASYLPPRTVARISDAEEAHTGRPVILNHSCDLLFLEHLRQQCYGFYEEPIVLCHDYQQDVMQSILGDSAEVRATDQTAN